LNLYGQYHNAIVFTTNNSISQCFGQDGQFSIIVSSFKKINYLEKSWLIFLTDSGRELNRSELHECL